MVVFFCGFIGVALIIASFAVKGGRAILSMMASGFFMAFTAGAYIESDATWDVYYALFFLGFILVAAAALLAVAGREKGEEVEDDGIRDEDRDLYEATQAEEKEREYEDRLYGPRRHKRSRSSKKLARAINDPTGIKRARKA